MREDLLLKLADLLDSVPPDHFDMSKWATNDPAHTSAGCGFAGCAIGWGIASQILPITIEERPRRLSVGPSVFEPVFGPYHRFNAVRAALELDYVEHAERLFSPSSYEPNVSPKDVAKAIRRYVDDEELPEYEMPYETDYDGDAS